jgi:hypothetical protein
MSKTFWVITHPSRKLKGHSIYYTEKYLDSKPNIIWTSKHSEIERFSSYQKAYAILNKIKDLGFDGSVVKVERD